MDNLYSQIDTNLWMGGCPVISPPREFEFIVNLYPWGEYTLHPHQISMQWALHDRADEVLERERLLAIAHTVKKWMSVGPTLVHCQMGQNRSGLITALVLMLHGMSSVEAISLLRAKRDPSVLNNSHFVEWLHVEGQRMRRGIVS